jgi:hypothetical protein
LPASPGRRERTDQRPEPWIRLRRVRARPPARRRARGPRRGRAATARPRARLARPARLAGHAGAALRDAPEPASRNRRRRAGSQL